MNVPKLRFKEFDGEWEERKLKDLTESISYGMNASAKEYDGENIYLRITDIDEESRTFIEKGKVSPDGELTEKYLLKENDILFTRTGASTGKSFLFKNEKRKFYFAGFLIRARIKKDVDAKFVYQHTLISRYYKWVKVMSMRSGQPGINGEEYGSFNIFLPSLNEQRKISSFLETMDKKIQLQQQKIDLLQEQKKGFLQKMFPKAGETHPEIRFDGFIGDWEELALKEVGDFIRTSIDPQAAPDFEFIEYSMPSYDNGRLPGHVLGKSMQSMRLKISGKVLLINKLNVRQKRIWLIEDAPDNAVASNEFMPFTSEKIDMNFLEQLMLSDETTRDLESISSGTSNSQKRITPSDVLKYKIKLPKKYDEQEKIGAFFKNMDENIGLQTQKLKIYKEQKKGFMQQMFI